MNDEGLRAQSETIGVVLLVGVVIVSVSGIGIAYLGDIDTDDGPRANLEAQVETGSLTLVHQGGASLPGDELRLLLRVNGSERPFAWNDSYLNPTDSSLDPGDEWRNASASFAPQAEVELRVIHRPSNTVILETLVNPTATPTATPVPTSTPTATPVPTSTPTGTETPTDTPSTQAPVPNDPPIADAGPDRTVAGRPDAEAELDGTDSRDRDGDGVAYRWRIVDRDGLSSSEAGWKNLRRDTDTVTRTASPTFEIRDTVDGREHVVQIELTVTDADGATDTDTVTVIVDPPPEADAGADASTTPNQGSGRTPLSTSAAGPATTVVPRDESVSYRLELDALSAQLSGDRTLALDGSGSTDDDPLSYEWAIGDGVTGTVLNNLGLVDADTVTPTLRISPFFLLSDVEVPVTLTVTEQDATPVSDSDSVTVTLVSNAGKPSISDVTVPSEAIVGERIDASVTTSDTVPITDYEWSFGDGTTASGADVSHTYTAPGTYTVTVEGTNAAGETATETQTVEVTTAPTAAFSISPSDPEAGETVTFDASASSDPDGDPLTYDWTFDDGSTASGAVVDRSFGSDGTYDVTLTVSDGRGGTDSLTRTVTVVTADASGPSVTASVTELTESEGAAYPTDDLIVNGDDELEVTADVSDPSGVADVNADVSAFGAGTVSLTDPDGDGTYSAQFTVDEASALPDGSYPVTVTATDGVGNEASDTAGPVELDTTGPDVSVSARTEYVGFVFFETTVTVTTDEPLGTLTVSLDTVLGSRQVELSDFDRTTRPDGSVMYTATEEQVGGQVDASLTGARDVTGNDASAVGDGGGTDDDPGPSGELAFSDVNDDGRYQSGEPTYTPAKLEQFDRQNVNLVIPSDVRVTPSNGKVSIKAGTVDVLGGTLASSSGQSVTITATSGAVRLDEASLDSGSAVTLKGNSVAVEGGTVRSAQGQSVTVTTESGPLTVDGVTIDSGSAVSLKGDSVTVTNSRIDSAQGQSVSVTAESGKLDLGESVVDSGAAVTIKGDRVNVAGAEVTSAQGQSVTLTAETGDLNFDGATVDSGASVTIKGDQVTGVGGRVGSPQGSSVTLTAEAGSLTLGDARLTSGASLTLKAAGSTDLKNAVLRSPSYATKKATLSTGRGTLSVGGSRILDDSGNGDVLVFDGKNTRQIQGCPAAGSIPGYQC